MNAALVTGAAAATTCAYARGQRIRVRKVDAPGHIRTPYYIRGKIGVIERCAGLFKNPEELAYGRSGQPLRALYRVRFVQSHVWDDYRGAPDDTLDIDLYEHWLEAVTTP